MISADLTNYFLLPKKLESVQPSSMADQVTWSPIMSSFFAIFPVDWIGHHLRPCCSHHHHVNDHCHPWRLLTRHVKTLLVNISISKFLNISVSQSGRYHNKIATKYLTTKYPNKIAMCHQYNFAFILIHIFCICLLCAYLSHFHCVLDVFALFKKRP